LAARISVPTTADRYQRREAAGAVEARKGRWGLKGPPASINVTKVREMKPQGRRASETGGSGSIMPDTSPLA